MSSIWIDTGSGKSRMSEDQMRAWFAGIQAYNKGDMRSAVASFDASTDTASNSEVRAAAMEMLSKQTIDPFDTMIKEAALAQIRRKDTSTRQKSFITGPRGLEGPMANVIFGGGSSMLGS